jgi:ABC-2 type transport system permease protein
MALFPLVFLSNILVPPATLPSWLETVVQLNPISHVATATRGLMAGDASAGDIALPLAEALALVLVFAPLTVRLYRGKG